jgi:hypothetical protein
MGNEAMIGPRHGKRARKPHSMWKEFVKKWSTITNCNRCHLRVCVCELCEVYSLSLILSLLHIVWSFFLRSGFSRFNNNNLD